MSERGGHIAVLVNPAAGRGAGSGQVAIERLRARGAVVRVYQLARRAVEEGPACSWWRAATEPSRRCWRPCWSPASRSP